MHRRLSGQIGLQGRVARVGTACWVGRGLWRGLLTARSLPPPAPGASKPEEEGGQACQQAGCQDTAGRGGRSGPSLDVPTSPRGLACSSLHMLFARPCLAAVPVRSAVAGTECRHAPPREHPTGANAHCVQALQRREVARAAFSTGTGMIDEDSSASIPLSAPCASPNTHTRTKPLLSVVSSRHSGC